MSTRDKHYTRTGDNLFTTLSNWASLIPFAGGVVSIALGVIGSAWDAGGWLLKGKPLSAATAFGTGVASTTTNAVMSAHPVTWGLNVITAIGTGRTIGTHARKGTEMAGSLVTSPLAPLGIQPTVLRSHQAGIGQIGTGFSPQQPGRFASQVSNQRGRNADQDWRAYADARAAEAQAMGAYRG